MATGLGSQVVASSGTRYATTSGGPRNSSNPGAGDKEREVAFVGRYFTGVRGIVQMVASAPRHGGTVSAASIATSPVSL